jgi:hypothetical protein
MRPICLQLPALFTFELLKIAGIRQKTGPNLKSTPQKNTSKTPQNMSQTRTLRETEDSRTANSLPAPAAPNHALYKEYMLNPSARFPRRRVDRTV